MIYTVTLNPSLDYYLKVNNLRTGALNRAVSERLTIGGKGVNVTLQLKKLGDKSVALGFVAGFTGKQIICELEKLGACHEFLEVEGRSRINVKIKSTAETDVNAVGAIVTAGDVKKLTDKLKDKLQAGDFVTIGGSAPAGLGNEVYADIIAELGEVRGVNFVVDACGKLLTSTLRYKPFMIKPNIIEMSEIFGVPIPDHAKAVELYARKLQQMGARNVIVSLGSSGAEMITEKGEALFVRAVNGQLVNSAGAGDCMIAGFIHEFIRTQDHAKALNFATATGSACAFTEGIPTKEQIEYIQSLML